MRRFIASSESQPAPVGRHFIGPLAALALSLVGCSTTHLDASPSSRATPPVVTVIPDFSKLTIGGTSCEGGSPRPCYQPLYKRPELVRPLHVTDIVNHYSLEGNIARVSYPYESYQGSKGDALTITCQVKGGEVTDAYHDTSSVWDVVRVPASQLNQLALQEASTAGAPEFGVTRTASGAVRDVYAFASNLWLGNVIYPQLPTCSPSENPANYPPAH